MARITVVQGDITAEQVDAVVNAANEMLEHGGGVAAAMVRAGGREVQEESEAWVRRNGPLGEGDAAVTTAGRMPARHVIHVVGPRYRAGQDNAGLLRKAIRAALDAARRAGAATVAIPAVSAGIFGYPRDEATRVIAGAVSGWLEEYPDTLEEVRLVGFDEGTAADFRVAVSALDAGDG